jgi:hypothetical protein
LPYSTALVGDQLLDLLVVGRVQEFQEEEVVTVVRHGHDDLTEGGVDIARVPVVDTDGLDLRRGPCTRRRTRAVLASEVFS